MGRHPAPHHGKDAPLTAPPSIPHDPRRPFDVLALDIDGTLLSSSKRLGTRDIEAVRAAADLGVRIVLATARPPRSTRPILNALGLLKGQPSPHAVTINYNGALTWDMVTGQPIEHLPLDPHLSRAVVTAARTADPEVLVWVEILDRWCTDRPHDESTGIRGTETSKTHGPDEIAPLDQILSLPATKIMFLADPAGLAPVFHRIVERFADPGLLACKVSDEHLFSVCSIKADKGAALESLCYRHNVPRERVMAIGDAPNDAQMLKWAGLGLAVKDAWPEARAAADEVLNHTSDEHAVAEAIERHILSRSTF